MRGKDEKPAFNIWDARELYEIRERATLRELEKDTHSPEQRQDIRGRLASTRHELKFIDEQQIKEGGIDDI